MRTAGNTTSPMQAGAPRSRTTHSLRSKRRAACVGISTTMSPQSSRPPLADARVAGGDQDRNRLLENVRLHEKVIRVVGRDRQQADAGAGEWRGNGGQHADRVERE